MRVTFKTLFNLGVAVFSMTVCAVAQAQDPALWEQYKKTFFSGDARVIDYRQGHASTSESQGYGMLLATSYDDRKAFENLWHWTRSNLSVRNDNLLAWLWGKRANGNWEAIDLNNATDGDVLVAFALLRASRRWDHEKYKHGALRIIRALREKMAVTVRGKTVLLPAYYGFGEKEGIVLNPSYMIFPAYRMFSEVDDGEFWKKVYRDSLEISLEACFGARCLPADWIRVTEDGMAPAEQWPPRFGYDAIRTLLHLSWERKPLPRGVGTALEAYRKYGYIPLWFDLKNWETSKEPALAGFYAIYSLAAEEAGDHKTSDRLLKEAKQSLLDEEKDYYSFSLYLLATIDEPL
jgi:endoglucanase